MWGQGKGQGKGQRKEKSGSGERHSPRGWLRGSAGEDRERRTRERREGHLQSQSG